MNRNNSQGQILSPIPPVFYQMILLVGLPESSAGRIRGFPLLTSTFLHGSLVAAVQRHGLTT
jgi:hypothetical protein